MQSLLFLKEEIKYDTKISFYKTLNEHILSFTIIGVYETSDQDWCTGMTQRDGMGREVAGGIGMGNTCKSMADSCQCMAKTTIIL